MCDDDSTIQLVLRIQSLRDGAEQPSFSELQFDVTTYSVTDEQGDTLIRVRVIRRADLAAVRVIVKHER